MLLWIFSEVLDNLVCTVNIQNTYAVDDGFCNYMTTELACFKQRILEILPQNPTLGNSDLQ